MRRTSIVGIATPLPSPIRSMVLAVNTQGWVGGSPIRIEKARP